MDPQPVAHSPLAECAVTAPLQADVDDLLRKKRKAREHKACYPCRQRKVKCDLARPCKTCRDREHPELCDYHPPNKRHEVQMLEDPPIKTQEASPASSVTLSRNDFDVLMNKLGNLERSVTELRREIKSSAQSRSDECDERQTQREERSQLARSHFDRNGLHTKNESDEFVHFGGGSIPALLYSWGQGQSCGGVQNLEQSNLQECLGKAVLPLFGLENESATYPFVDLWVLRHGPLKRAREVVETLPTDAQILTYFECYRDLAYIIYPAVADLKQLEVDLNDFLAARRAAPSVEAGITPDTIFGKHHHWLGLVFAVLASGAQACARLPRKERELTSSFYVCCSLECLRLTNFLSLPVAESIQALLVMGSVMSNNMNAGTAWSLLGATIRLAQGLGLHQSCPPRISAKDSFPRSTIWWAVVWQDSLISISYDRYAMLDLSTSMPMPQTYGTVNPYHAAMYKVSKVALAVVRDRALHATAHDQIVRMIEHHEALRNIRREAAQYLQDIRICQGFRENLENWGLYMHISYVMSELFRPAINRSTTPEIKKMFKDLCVENLVNTVEAYLGIAGLTFYVRQSWGAVHRGLSSALLLGILGEHERNERARHFMSLFVSQMGEWSSTDAQQDVPAPLQRGIKALQRFNIDRRRESSSGAPGSNPSTAASLDGKRLLISESDSAMSIDQNHVFTPSARSDGAGSSAEEGFSPHSVLHSILWGGDDD